MQKPTIRGANPPSTPLIYDSVGVCAAEVQSVQGPQEVQSVQGLQEVQSVQGLQEAQGPQEVQSVQGPQEVQEAQGNHEEVQTSKNPLIRGVNGGAAPRFLFLTFSGSGIRGIMYVGALYMLHKLKLLDIKGCAGSSFGGLAATMVVLGYSVDEMYSTLAKFDYSKLMDVKILSAIDNLGLDSGLKIRKYLRGLFRRKSFSSRITFEELWQRTGLELVIVTTCVSRRASCYMSHVHHGDTLVLDALSASMSIPWLFCPVIINDEMYVDGGLTDNFPVKAFEPHNSIALEITTECTHTINDPMEYTAALVETVFRNNRSLACGGWNGKIIQLFTCVSAGEFLLSKEQKLDLVRIGMATIEKHFT